MDFVLVSTEIPIEEQRYLIIEDHSETVAEKVKVWIDDIVGEF